MKTIDRAWFVLTTLCLAAACGPSTPETGSGGSSGDSGTTSDPSATNPTNPTLPDPDTGVGTGDVTGNPTTTTNPTTGPDDTTGDPPGEGCCDVHDTPGCTEPAVVDCVCRLEAFCCAFEWDANCVDVATNMCDATCEDPGTTGDPTGTTTGSGTACDEIVTFEMLPSEATYSGDWDLGMSMIGEGEISVVGQFGGTDGSFLYEPDIPCDDTWYIWARYFDQGSDDSYFATLDGEPMPEAIFEGDCTGGGNGYDWAVLNWRDQGANPCEYIEDPWAPVWDAGLHQIEFSYRESPAMGRILLTNDPALIPPP